MKRQERKSNSKVYWYKRPGQTHGLIEVKRRLKVTTEVISAKVTGDLSDECARELEEWAVNDDPTVTLPACAEGHCA